MAAFNVGCNLACTIVCFIYSDRLIVLMWFLYDRAPLRSYLTMLFRDPISNSRNVERNFPCTKSAYGVNDSFELAECKIESTRRRSS